MTEDEFHKQRRMFAVVENSVIVAPEGLEQSHRDWIHDLFPEQWVWIMVEFERGYVLGDTFMIYTGDNQFSPDVNADSVVAALKIMTALYPNIYTLGFGAKPSSEQPWKPKKRSTILTYKPWLACVRHRHAVQRVEN